jgi:hypothetical protein
LRQNSRAFEEPPCLAGSLAKNNRYRQKDDVTEDMAITPAEANRIDYR